MNLYISGLYASIVLTAPDFLLTAMQSFLALAVAALVVIPAATASPAVSIGAVIQEPLTPYVEFVSQNLADTKLRFVRNSGVCETTPGVDQLSGYVDIGTNMSMVRLSRLKSS